MLIPSIKIRVRLFQSMNPDSPENYKRGVLRLILSKGTPWKKQQAAAENGLLLFPWLSIRKAEFNDISRKINRPLFCSASSFL